jgi:endo-1,4-beta-xylanase
MRSFPRKAAPYRTLGFIMTALVSAGGVACSGDGSAVDDVGSGGGAPTTGGSPGLGGSPAGGVPGIGGQALTGGAPSTGGQATGGSLTQTGGASSGGADASGGSAASGGESSGGAGTGGQGTGGEASAAGGSPGRDPNRKFVGNITTGWNAAMDTGGRVYADYWDQVTPENAGKWGSVQSRAGADFNWKTLDSIYDYAMQHDLLFKEHVFIWGSQQPTGTIGEADVKAWMKAFCERYPETKLIDVVNEPPPHTEADYTGAIGGGTNSSWQWITNAFKWAREACPDAILIFNDYNNVEYGDQNQHFIDITKAVLAAGGPIDAVGAQSHAVGAVGTNTMKNLMTKLHNDTGLPVYVTEYDINESNDQTQLSKYQEHMEFYLTTDWVPGVTVWGWIYGQTWVTSSGLIRDGQPRPAMTWLMERLDRKAP